MLKIFLYVKVNAHFNISLAFYNNSFNHYKITNKSINLLIIN